MSSKTTIDELQRELADKRQHVEECEAVLEREQAAAEEYVRKKVGRAREALDRARSEVDEYVGKVASALGLPDPTAARRAKARYKEIRTLASQGKTPVEIAAKTETAVEEVQRYLGGRSKSSGGSTSPSPEKTKGWKRRRVLELLRAGKSYEEVAADLETSVVAVKLHAYELRRRGDLPEDGPPAPSASSVRRPPSDPDEPDEEPDDPDEPDEEPASPRGGSPRIPPVPPCSEGDGVDALRAEVARQQGGQRAKAVVLLTTAVNGHAHKVVVDRLGDGTTQEDETGHVHKVYRFVVTVAADHRHGLRVLPTRP